MVNYESPERQEHQRILVHTTALIADCMNIEVWEDFFCINQLNKANYYKAKLEKFESDDNDETSIRDAKINDLDLTISRLQALKLINK
ncbi:hypothetical protein [Methanobacterium sp.]|uniref:hypothetical protein n=1 Tax=Methanobacterium sp. TaxID=2164 RepID=UPI003C767E3A